MADNAPYDKPCCTVAVSLDRIAPEDGDYPRCGQPAITYDPIFGFPMCDEHARLFELDQNR